MNDNTNRENRRRPRVLCVSDDAEFLEMARGTFDEVADLQVEADVDGAMEALRTRPYSGALIDTRTVGMHAVRVATEYLAHQPAGRVVIACPSADSTTLCNTAARDPRAEIVFDPFIPSELRARLLGPVEMGSFTRRAQQERRPLAHLLKR